MKADLKETVEARELKLSHYTLRRSFEGEEVQLLLTLELGTRWG
jgi:hypothetical protein